MILLARQSRGLSQGEAATRLGVSQGTLSKIEHGLAEPAPQVLDGLSEVLGYPTALFGRPEHVLGTESICFHHRKRASMPTNLLTTIEAKMYLTQLQIRRFLEDVEIESANGFLSIDPDEYDGPEAVARVVRSAWRIGRGPIPNLVKTIESAGGIVYFSDFATSKLDGMSCWPKGGPPLFFINSRIPVDRARHTIAHELGHLIMHSVPPSENPEVQATAFAREFLTPAADILPDLQHLRFAQLPGLKGVWRVSMSSLVMTAKALGALPDPKLKSLFVQISRQGWRSYEPFPLAPEPPTTLNRTLQLHMTQHGYSPAELAELADLRQEEFETLYLASTGPHLKVLS
jgi:Zn-dependent peptidase ImmA (M78 family)/DNA-binding XRE family transcriptional regulator